MSFCRVLLSAFLVLLLGACSNGGDKQRPVLPDFPDGSGNILPNQRGVIFAYPAREQTEVSQLAPIALRFSHPLELGGLDGEAGAAVAAGFFRLVDVVANTSVPFTLTLIPQPAPTSPPDDAEEAPDLRARGVLIQPTKPLKPNTLYRVQSNDVGSTNPAFKGVALATGDVNQSFVTMPATGAKQFVFTTRSALSGAISSQSADPEFKVLRTLPNSETALIDGFPLLDFSTLRLQFSQPVDPNSATYAAAGTVKLVDKATGVLVPARFLISGNRMVIDPLNDLSPSKTYVLSLTSGLQSKFGRALTGGFTQEFSPRDTRPEGSDKLTVNKISVPLGNLTSILTGSAANRVPVASEILGRGAEAPDPAAEGLLFADLAHSPNFKDISPAVLPIRVPANSELTAATLVVKLGGKTAGVPANLETGTLSIKLISDANGLVLPNRYNNSPNAPSLVNLVMDVAVSAEVATANGAFTQDILHVEVNGIATLDQKNRILNLEAVGVVELKILGVDDAIGILSLKLASDDLSKPPSGVPAPDTTRPVVQSWAPGGSVTLNPDLPLALTVDAGELILPGDSLIVNFSKIMESASLSKLGAVSLEKGTMPSAINEPVPITTRLDGASLVINAALEHGSFYRIKLNEDIITDLSGNKLNASPNSNDGVPTSDLVFSLPALVATRDTERSPIALGVYPGYPCAIAEGSRNVAANQQGICRGGKSSDDVLPLPSIEQSRDIKVAFSQSIAKLSVRQATTCNGMGSLRVERVDASGNCLSVVQGQINVKPRELSFTPAEPWVKGQLYRYVLGSNNKMMSSAADCLGNQSICGVNGLPLQTQLISQTPQEVKNPRRGGPPMEIFFRGGDDLGGANISMRVLPVTDVDGNFTFEKGERKAKLADGTDCETGREPGIPATVGRCFTPNSALLQPDSANPLGAFTGAATQLGVGCKNGEFAEDDPNRPNGRGTECQGNQFLLISTALSAKLGGLVTHPTTGQQVVEVLVDPTIVITTGADIFAEIGVSLAASPLTAPIGDLIFGIPVLGDLLKTLTDPVTGLINGILPISISEPVPTGLLVFRMRYAEDVNGNPSPIRGFISEGPDGPELEAVLNLYADIPELDVFAEILGVPAVRINHNARSNEDLKNFRMSGKVNFLPDGRLTVSLVNDIDKPLRLGIDLSGLGGLLGGTLRVYIAPQRIVLDASLAPIKQ